MKKRALMLLLALCLVLTAIPGISALAAEKVSSRDDGVWLFPMQESAYYSFTDWAGCPGGNKCPFHGVNHYGDGSHNWDGSTGHGHNGIDIGYNGDVYAAATGKLYSHNSNDSARGLYIIIEHDAGTDSSGQSWSYYSLYQHLSYINTSLDYSTLKKPVEVGTTIGHSGGTGGSETYGTHLHFAVMLSTSGRGSELASNLNSLYNIQYERGWVLEPGFIEGEILENPVFDSSAGTPGEGISGVREALSVHQGSIRYTFDPSEVTVGRLATSYIDKCTAYPTNLKVKIANTSAYFKSLPCSASTDKNSTNVVSSPLPKGTVLTVNTLYVNDQSKCWYKTTYNGKEGYIYSGDTERSSFEKNTVSTSGGSPTPTSLEPTQGYYAAWLVSSSHLNLDTIQGYIYDSNGNALSGYPSEKTGINAKTYQLGCEYGYEAVDSGLHFSTLSAGSYSCSIKVKCKYYYGDANGKLCSSDNWSVPISFTFTKKGAAASSSIVQPLSSLTVTSGFVPNRTLNEWTHLSTDYSAYSGQPVMAIADGTVKRAEYNSAGGYMVDIEHNINGETTWSRYQHFCQAAIVSVGQEVSAGQTIGYAGETGEGAYGVHLHIQIFTGTYCSSLEHYRSAFSGYPENQTVDGPVEYNGTVYWNPDRVIRGIDVIGNPAPVSGFRFSDVVYPETFKIDTNNGWFIQGGIVESDAGLSTLQSDIFTSDGSTVTSYGPVNISGSRYSIRGIDSGVLFNLITTEGDYVWRLTAIDAANRKLILDMPFYATNSGETRTDTAGTTYIDGVQVNSQNFPDANFRTYISESFDKDHNGALDKTEIENVYGIYVSSKGIRSLQGIEYFNKLLDLTCDGNQLTSLDLSKNTALIILYCNNNQLKQLNVNGCTSIKTIVCDNNQLTTLDLRNKTKLGTLECEKNSLTTLNVSGCTALESINCEENQLSFLDVSDCAKLKDLNCKFNRLTSLDVRRNTQLKSLSCSVNQLQSLDLSNNTQLAKLYCSNNQELTNLILGSNTNLSFLSCHYTQLSSLDIRNIPILVDLVNAGAGFREQDDTVVKYKSYDINGNLSRQLVYDQSTNLITGIAKSYSVNYDANGGTGAPAAQTKTQGQALTLSSTKPTRTGYTFQGWAESSSATAASYTAGGSFTKDGDTTLYAVWKAKTYTISFNANGGSGAPKAQTKTYGKALTLSKTVPTRSGYSFLGWSTSKTAAKATYTAGGKYTKNAKATLYAVWEKSTVLDGLQKGSDGKYYLYQDGAVNTGFTGLYTNDDGTWYIREGRLAEDFTGCDWVNGEYCEFLKGQLTTWKKDATVVDPKGDGNWVSMRWGKVDMTYTGIAENANGFWYINNGVLDLTYTDFVTNDYGTWFIYKGQLANWRTGCDWVNGGYYEFVEGQLTTWKKDATVVDPKGDGNWVAMRYGRIDMSYTGIAENKNGFWYVKNGKLDLTYTDLVTNDYGTWFIYKGQLANWRTGCDWVNGGYYEFVEGQLTTWKKDATVVDPNGDGNWVSMRYGRIDMSYTGIAENENGFWYIKDGKLDLTFTGLVKNDYGTWFIYLGQLANWRTGIDTVNGKQYYFVEAQLGDWFSGDYIQDNVIYHVVNGVVTGTN